MNYSWLSTFALVFVPGLAVYLIIYLLSKIMSSNQLYAEFKQNINELIMSLLLFVIVVATVGLGDDLANSQLGYQTLSIASEHYISSEISNITKVIKIMGSYVQRVSTQGATSAYCTVQGVFGVSLSGCGSYSVFTTPLPSIMNALFVTLAELKSLFVLLTFNDKYVLALIFPLGLFLRIFSFSRGAGGVIISIAITLYFVVPFTILLYSDLMKYVSPNNYKFDTPEVPLCSPVDITVYSPFSESAVRRNYDNVFSIPKDIYWAMLFFVKTTLLVSLVLAVLVAAPTSLSRALGVYVDFSSLQRLI